MFLSNFRRFMAVALLAFAPASAFAQDGEIVLAAPRDLAPGQFDPYYTNVALLIWEPLVRGGEDGQPQPGLAESWSMSPDGKVWTFVLRQGVKFQDGEALDADAVLKNFERFRIVTPRSSPFFTMNIEQSYPGLEAVTKLDDHSFSLTFAEPRPTLLYSMVNYSSPIFSPANFAENGDFNGLPQGTGPFRLAEHEKDGFALLQANPDYYGDKPAAEFIRVRVINDPETRLSALKAEEIMGVLDFGAVPPEQAFELAKDDRFGLSVGKSVISHYLHVNGTKPYWSDVRLRQAISLAVDRETIVRELYHGYPLASVNLLTATSPFYKEQELRFDPAAAKALAQQVLGETRLPALLIIPANMLDRYPYKAQAEFIQYELAGLGIDIEVRVLDQAAWRDATAKGEFDITIVTQSAPNTDAFTMLNNYMSSTGAANVGSSLGYANAEVDALLVRVSAALDMDERRAIYGQLQDIAAAELPTIPLFNDTAVIAFNKRVTGYAAGLYGPTLTTLQWAE